MKAVVVRQHGDAKTALKVETDFVKPTANKNQVLIKNEYAGLNFIDTYYRKGLYKQQLPFVSGQEGGGIIVEINTGDDCIGDNNLKVGDRVVYLGGLGSYATYTAVPSSKVVKVPDGISLEVALACMVQGLTAHYLVTDASAGLISPGQWCLIYSVGSGTGQWACQIAKLQGYKVIGTTSKTKQAQAEACGGCDELIVLDTIEGKTYADYESVDIVSRVMDVTSHEGVKLVVDGVGKSTVDISIACLARRGIFVSFGNASGPVPPFSLLSLTPKSAFCTRPKLNDYVSTPEELNRRCQDVFGWVKDGKLRVSVDKIFAIDQAADGHEFLESGKSRGKVLFKID